MRVEDQCFNCGRPALVGLPPSERLALVIWFCTVCEECNATAWDYARDEPALAEVGDFHRGTIR